jgi:hypothetical protein
MGEILQLPFPEFDPPTRLVFSDDELVNDLLAGGDDLTNKVSFGSDKWNLEGHRSWKDKSGAMVGIDFTQIPRRWRVAAKELAVLQVNPSLALERLPNVPMAAAWPAIQEPIVLTTAQGNIKMLGHALTIIEQHGITQFDNADWERIVALLIQPANKTDKQEGATLSTGTARGRAQQLIALWQVCQISGREKLLGEHPPFDGRPVSDLYRKKQKENAVRPHEAVGHVLGFVAWFFDNVAEDVVAHIEWWVNNTRREELLDEHDRFDAMLGLCAELASQSEGILPGSLNQNGGLTLSAAPLGRLLGMFDADEAYLAGRWAKSQLRDTVKFSTSHSPCPLPISELPNARGELTTWTDRLLASKDSLDIWQRRLVYSAMYYLSATVMLRDSQLAVLPFDPLRIEEISRPDGTTFKRHTLSAFKTKNRHVATPTTVVVNARIASIIALLHRLQRVLGYEVRRSEQTGLPYLFDQLLATPYGKTIRTGNREGLYLERTFLAVIQEGAKELHERGVIARNLDDVKLNMRQVRITCAQAYAVREHGQALAAAFGQWDSAAVASGYIGEIFRIITPLDPSEAKELVLEDTGRRLHLMARDRQTLTGKGVTRLEDAIGRSAEILSNPQPLTPARMRALGKNNLNITQGPLSLCVYQPEGALCGGQGKADFRLCAPGQCRNSVMTLSDRARYELMRRQQLGLGSPRSIGAAKEMDERNPEISLEFADTPDDGLHRIIAKHLDEYIQAALEDRT